MRVKTTQVSVSIASYSKQAIFDEGNFIGTVLSFHLL